jgi:hypothetical protein
MLSALGGFLFSLEILGYVLLSNLKGRKEGRKEKN